MGRIELLGAPRILRGDGTVVAPRGAKAWAVLAHVLLTGSPTPRSRLASLLFADAADPAGALRWNLAELRRALGPEVDLGGDPVGVTLPATWTVDVHVLRSGDWREAMRLERLGEDLLAGVTLSDASGFTLWLEAERRHVHALGVGALRDAARALLARGESARAREIARRLVGLAPYDEQAHALHVRTVAEDAGADAAAAALTDARRFLEDHLDRPAGDGLLHVLDRHLGSPRTRSGTAAALAQLETGRAAVAAGAVEAGIDALGRAVVSARASGDQRLLATSLLEVGSALVHAARGSDAEGAGALHEAAALAEALDDDALAATAHRELGYVELLQANYEQAAWWLDRAEALASGDDGELAWIDAVRSHVLQDVGRHGDAEAAATRAVDRGDRGDQPRAAVFALASLGRSALLRDQLDHARDVLDEAVARTRGIGWLAFLPWPECFAAEAMLRAGEVDAADEAFDHALTMGQQLGDPCWESVALRGLGLVAARRQEHDRALDLLARAPRACRRLPDSYRWVEGYGLEAVTAAAVQFGAPAAGEWADALVAFASEHGLRELLARGARHQASLGRPGAADLAETLAAGLDNPVLRVARPVTPA